MHWGVIAVDVLSTAVAYSWPMPNLSSPIVWRCDRIKVTDSLVLLLEESINNGQYQKSPGDNQQNVLRHRPAVSKSKAPRVG